MKFARQVKPYFTCCADLKQKHPLQFSGEGVSHDPHLQENGSGFDDPLESVGLGSREAVEAFQGDEDFVGAGVGEAQVAEGHARGGIGDGTGLLVVGNRLEVAHGHRDGAGVGGETDELFRVIRRDEGRFVLPSKNNNGQSKALTRMTSKTHDQANPFAKSPCVSCRAAKPGAGSATFCGLPANRSFLDRRLVRRSFSEGGSLGVGGSLGEGGSEVWCALAVKILRCLGSRPEARLSLNQYTLRTEWLK